MIKYLNNSIAKLFITLVFALLVTACTSGPDKQKPEILENAYKNLKSGVTNYNKSEYALAQSYFKTALNSFRSIDHRQGIASSCLNIAKIHLERNDLSSANDYLSIAESLISESKITTLKNHLATEQAGEEVNLIF